MPSEQSRHHSKSRYPAFIPDSVWAPLSAAISILVVGLLGLAVNQPWLFPSLGPTIFLQAEQPEQPTARFYNVVMGHLHGLLAGIAIVLLLGANTAPPVLSTGELTPVRVWASVLSIALTMLLGFMLKASHPPAAATTLLVSLGGFKPTLQDATTVMIGVLIMAILGEGLRRFRLRKQL